MINTSDGYEQVFTCKIFSSLYYIKLNIANKLINIIVVKSKKGKTDTEFINYYTLSHLQETNSYFKIYNSIKDIYKDLLKMIKNKNFSIVENEDKTLSLIMNVQINDKMKEIVLTLVKNKNIFNLNEKRDYNTIEALNSELNVMKNRLNELEIKQTLPPTYSKASNYSLYPNAVTSPNNSKLNKLVKILDKLDHLENENETKTERIKQLENKLNFYENNNGSINYDYKRNVYSTFINKNNNASNNYNVNTMNNDLKQSYYSRPNNYSVYSDNFEITNKGMNNYQRKKKLYHSMEKDQYNERINKFDDNDGPTRTRYNYSSDIRYNNNERSITNFSKIRVDDTGSDIPIYKRENILNLNSRIIFRIKEVQLLMRKLSRGEKNNTVHLNLLYRASRDGDAEEIIRIYCQDKLNLLTLFYTTEGARFGVYTEKYIKKSIRNGDHWHEVPGSSFIISLNNLIYYNVIAKRTSLNNKINNMLCFGFCSRINNNETNFLIYTSRNNFLGKRYLFGDKNDVYYNLDYKKIVGNNRFYKIKDVEIFEVDIESF